ncbi:MAG: 30S ribosomal protein S5 [Candidatus Pacebacteria bacterium]|nr:30S ribosomal protein S5 [Candidatus Paceibacterota bacterium]
MVEKENKKEDIKSQNENEKNTQKEAVKEFSEREISEVENTEVSKVDEKKGSESTIDEKAIASESSSVKATVVNKVTVDEGKKPFKKNFNPRKRSRFIKPKSEFDQKIIKIRRVTRVMSGGRRFSFSVAIVLGNRKGKIGVGIAKAGDTALAIEKAVKNAKKNMVQLKLTNNNSISYELSKKYCASVIKLIPTKEGKGLSAGSAVKTILELAGITDVSGKIMTRSKNKLNIARATVGALEDFKITGK